MKTIGWILAGLVLLYLLIGFVPVALGISNGGGGGGTGVLVAAVALLYFLPSIVAFTRHHHNRVSILLLNFFLGWTFIGWIACSVWAASYIPTEARDSHP